MKTNAFYRLFLLAVISSFLSTHLDAQGNIFRMNQLAKRRAAIASGTTARNMKKGNGLMYEDHGVTSGFVMRNTGQLQVYYAYANRLDRELPANAALRAHFVKGDSTRSDSLIPRFPNAPPPWSRYLYNDCYGTFQYRYEYDYTNTGSPESVYLANLGHVTQGDTVQFYYVSDNIQTGDSVIYGIFSADTVGTAWDVIFGNVDYCVYDYSDVLNVYIGVSPEIMLGETKYYYATNDNGQLTIHETTSPTLPSGAVGTDIWGDNPVSVVITDPAKSGRKLGAYWDKKYPIYLGGEFIDLDYLPTGMIRLVGRYWHADSLYKVNLSNSGQTATMTIEVKKPSSLGTTYSRGIDITNPGQNYSIDSMCIKWGGIYGFPPQHIKAQITKESVYQGGVFHPAYRYEPWSRYGEFDPNVAALNSHFRTTLGPPRSMGDGGAVPDHHNLLYMTYVQEAQSVWYFIQQYSTIEYSPAPSGHSLFGSRDTYGNLVW